MDLLISICQPVTVVLGYCVIIIIILIIIIIIILFLSTILKAHRKKHQQLKIIKINKCGDGKTEEEYFNSYNQKVQSSNETCAINKYRNMNLNLNTFKMNDQYSIKNIKRLPQPTRDITSGTVSLRTIVLPALS